MQSTIQIVELEKLPNYCPFCGERVLVCNDEDEDEDGDIEVVPCPHTLFVATDADFEYRSDIFDKNLNIQDEDDLWELINDSEEDLCIDTLIDKLSVPNAVKFSSYESAPSFLGVYIGFAPLD